MFYLSALIVFFLDQAVKLAVVSKMFPNQSVPLIKDVLHLTYVRNTGAAFGLFYGKQFLLIPVGIVLMAVIFGYYYFSSARRDWSRIPLGLLIGGSLGNTFDRIFRHFVVDYIDFRVFPVFNLADAMINLGVFLILVKFIFMKENDKNASHPA